MIKPEAVLSLVIDLYTQVAELQNENRQLRADLQRLEERNSD